MCSAAAKRYVSPLFIGVLYGMLGDIDQGIQWLEKGYEERDGLMPSINSDPNTLQMRSDPRFTGLIQRLGLPA